MISPLNIWNATLYCRYGEEVAAEAKALGLEKEDYQDEEPAVNNNNNHDSRYVLKLGGNILFRHFFQL